jgi:hypothetical protein
MAEVASLPELRQCVDPSQGYGEVRLFSGWERHLCLTFTSLTLSERRWDIQPCLPIAHRDPYDAGDRSTVGRNTLVPGDELRGRRICAAFARRLVALTQRPPTTEAFGAGWAQTVRTVDTRLRGAHLTQFAWLPLRPRKGALNLRTLLTLRRVIPV